MNARALSFPFTLHLLVPFDCTIIVSFQVTRFGPARRYSRSQSYRRSHRRLFVRSFVRGGVVERHSETRSIRAEGQPNPPRWCWGRAC